LLQNKNKSGLYTIWIGVHPIVCVMKPEFIKVRNNLKTLLYDNNDNYNR